MSLKNNEFSLSDLNTQVDKIDLSPNFDFNNYSDLITDWSGIYLEFLIIKRKKPILINTKMKIRNLNYEKFSMKPIELELRDSLTFQFEINQLDKLSSHIINNMYDNKISTSEFSDKVLSNFYKI